MCVLYTLYNTLYMCYIWNWLAHTELSSFSSLSSLLSNKTERKKSNENTNVWLTLYTLFIYPVKASFQGIKMYFATKPF